MMILLLAFRNVLRNLRRLAPMMLILVLVFTSLVMGNAVLSKTIDALYSVYALNVTGDLTVSARDKNNFTVFGSDQLLVGQYLLPPVLEDYQNLKNNTESLPEVRSTSGLISSAARVELGGQKKNAAVLGVNFESYRKLATGLTLEEGSFPLPGEPGIIVQKQGWKGAEKLIGEKVLISAALGRSFILREVPLTGVVSYPVRDKMLDKVVLVDADTARALNGYLYKSEEDLPLSVEDQTALESDLDSLFSSDMDGGRKGSEDKSISVDPMMLFSGSDANVGLSDNGNGGPDNNSLNVNSSTVETEAWNFLLVSLYDRRNIESVTSRLTGSGFNKNRGYLIRDWSSSIGGSAQLAWFLQLLFNFGLLFVSFGAVIIATNAMLLSILERTGEIGALRAMGATRSRISVMIFLETLMVVFGSAVAGILVGRIGTQWLNEKGLVINNPYIQILFGGEPVKGEITLKSVAGHLSAAFFLAVISMLYPLKRALGISPVEAMTE